MENAKNKPTFSFLEICEDKYDEMRSHMTDEEICKFLKKMAACDS